MSYSVNGDPPLVFCDRGFSMFGIGTGRKPDLPHLHCQAHDTMPSSPPGNSAPSRVVQALDRALDQSHDVKAEVEACAADLGAANELARAQISHGTKMLPAAQALENGLAIEQRVQGCADDLQQVTVDLARGLDEVRAVEQALERSRAALATSEAALARSRTAQRQSTLRDTASKFDDAPAGARPTLPGAAAPSCAVIKVLIAEDDAFMRDLMHRVLDSAGMQVATYASGAELLGAGNFASATVLLLDVNMPGMSGLDLQERLRHRGVDLPVVFVSGATEVALAVTAMRNGAADYIEKPFDGAFLIERVRRAVARHAGRMATADRQADPLVVARFESLTPREREVFDLLVTGMSSKLIARDLGGSFRTIEIHRAQVMHKMEARHLSELVRMSIESMPRHRAAAR